LEWPPCSSIDCPAAPTLVCPDINSIPPGRQPAKILKCGFHGCTSTTLFDRKYELARYMMKHQASAFPCLINGCPRKGQNGFYRKDKLMEHEHDVHGM
jgi:hypothetical protein